MDWKMILSWLLTIATTLPEKLPQTLMTIEAIVNQVEELIKLWGLQFPLAAGFAETSDAETKTAEQQIADCLKSQAGEGRAAVDFSRIKAILAKAKQLGILDVIMAVLVQKVPLPTNT